MLSLRTGCPWRELPAIYGNANTLMSRYNRWKKDDTLDRITAALGFEPMTDYERHRRQGYGLHQRAQFRRDGLNPWLHNRDDDTDIGRLSKLWAAGKD